MISIATSSRAAFARPAPRKMVMTPVASQKHEAALAQHACTLAVALGLALAPGPAFAMLPEGVSSPQPQDLDAAFESKMQKIQGLADIETSGAPVSLDTIYEANRKPINAEKGRPAPVRVVVEEPEQLDIRQAAIEAAGVQPTEAPRAAKEVRVVKRADAPASAATAATAAPSPALIGGAVAILAVAAAAASANKGEEQQAATPAAIAGEAATAASAASAAATPPAEPAAPGEPAGEAMSSSA